jgi:hypothetical protein
MHIEKNEIDNIFNMMMDVKGKTKDNMKTKLDLPLYCDRDIIELINDGFHIVKPKVIFTLDNNGQLFVYE